MLACEYYIETDLNISEPLVYMSCTAERTTTEPQSILSSLCHIHMTTMSAIAFTSMKIISS